MTFTYYTYTAGPVAQKAFNAVATFFNTQSFCRLSANLHHGRA